MPTWLLLSLLFPGLLAVVNILDKVIVDRYAPAIYYYSFWIGVYEIVIGSAVLGGVVGAQGLDTGAFAGGMLVGAVRALSLLLLLAALKRGQVTRVAPINYLYPLMVAPLAVVFLDEDLSAVAWGAIVLAVAGAALVSWQRGAGERTFGNPAVLALAFCGAVFFAASITLSKHFLTEENFWQFYGSTRVGVAFGMLSVVLIPEVRQKALGTVRNRGFMAMVGLVEGVVTVATIINFAAITLGPVSLVAAISALQPSLVFLYSLGLSRVSPAYFGDWIVRRTLRPQVAGILAIAAGIVLISVQVG